MYRFTKTNQAKSYHSADGFPGTRALPPSNNANSAMIPASMPPVSRDTLSAQTIAHPEPSVTWHDLAKDPHDLPTEAGLYLVRHTDGSMTLRRFTAKGYFWTDRDFDLWTDDYEPSSVRCLYCPSDSCWREKSGRMWYTCSSECCTAPDAEDPI